MVVVRDGIPRRLTFKKLHGKLGFRLLKVLNVPAMNDFVGSVYLDDELKRFARDPKVDVVVK